MKEKEKPRVNFTVLETWTVECPECGFEQDAPLDDANPMQPLDVRCAECDFEFVLTYNRDEL